MPIGDQDHRRIAMAVASMLARTGHQHLDFPLGELPAGSALSNCQVYGASSCGVGCWKHRANSPVPAGDYACIEL